MAKKKFSAPFLILSGLDNGGNDEVIGGGSGQSGQGSWLCDYDEWLIMYATDYDYDEEEFSFMDYGIWFLDNGGTPEQWEIFNPGTPYPTRP